MPATLPLFSPPHRTTEGIPHVQDARNAPAKASPRAEETFDLHGILGFWDAKRCHRDSQSSVKM